ncbi:polyprotein [Sapphire II virus]|nr:polyprotein [Sapphire II virus]QLA46844.1 polyprotein [Sapphire II virus]
MAYFGKFCFLSAFVLLTDVYTTAGNNNTTTAAALTNVTNMSTLAEENTTTAATIIPTTELNLSTATAVTVKPASGASIGSYFGAAVEVSKDFYVTVKSKSKEVLESYRRIFDSFWMGYRFRGMTVSAYGYMADKWNAFSALMVVDRTDETDRKYRRGRGKGRGLGRHAQSGSDSAEDVRSPAATTDDRLISDGLPNLRAMHAVDDLEAYSYRMPVPYHGFEYLTNSSISKKIVMDIQGHTRYFTWQNRTTHGAFLDSSSTYGLICRGATVDHNSSQTLPTNWTSLHNFPDDCSARSERVYVKDLSYINAYYSSDRGHSLIVVSYITAFLGMGFRNCKLVIEADNCITRTMNFPTQLYFTFHSKHHVLPIIHIMAYDDEENAECELSLCGLVKAKSSKGVFKTEKVKVEVYFDKKAGSHHRLRRLLSTYTPSLPKKSKCSTKNQLLGYQRSLIHNVRSSIPGPKVSFCNGTLYTEHPTGELHGCYQVGKKKAYHQCPGRGVSDNSKEDVNCTVEYHFDNCDPGMYCFHVSLNGTGTVRIMAKGIVQNIECVERCMASIPESESDFTVTCPDGKVHRLHYNLVDHNCPHIWLFGKYALYFCRATSRPQVLHFAILWLFFGFPSLYSALTVLKYLLSCFGKVAICVKRRMDRKKGTCPHCGEYVASWAEWQRHEECKIGSCPYCNSRFSLTNLTKHAKECLDKDKVLKADEDVVNLRLLPRVLRLFGIFTGRFQRHSCKITWLVVLVILIGWLTSPVSSLQNVALQEGLWDDELREVSTCTSECLFLKDRCVCGSGEYEEEFESGRKLLSLETKIKKGTYSKKTHQASAEFVADVQAPWGTVHIQDTFSPSYSTSSISMTWRSVETAHDGKVVLNGKSTSLLRIEPKTGLTWNLQSEKAAESKMLMVNLVDSTQIYRARFDFMTGDRVVGGWMHGTCKIDCPDKCGCESSSCYQMKWSKSRNWHCNPTWCWEIDRGCTCCAVDVNRPFEDWLLTKWSLEYVGTESLICVEYEHEERHCEVVNTESTFSYGPYRVQVSGAIGVQKRLPAEIALVHRRPGDQGTIDLMKVHHVLSANNLCKLQSCTHGAAGDFQVYDLDKLVLNDVSSEFFFLKKEGKKVDRSHWTSWQGVTLSYHCLPGRWPECFYSNLVEKNSEAFKNLLAVEQDYIKDYFFHSLHCRINGSTPALELLALPMDNAGHHEVYLEVNNLKLTPVKVQLEDLTLTLVECNGCYGCVTGVSCTVNIHMDGAESLTVHLESTTPEFTISRSSISIRMNEITSAVVKGFSPVPLKKICLTLKEKDLCPTCTLKLESCTDVKLDEPERILLEHRSLLISSQKDNCTSWFSCWSSGFSEFGKSILSLFSGLLGGPLKAVIAILIIVGIAAGLVIGGPKLFACLKLFKKGRALKKVIDNYNGEGIRTLSKNLKTAADDPDDLFHLIAKRK